MSNKNKVDADFVDSIGEMISYFMEIKGNTAEDCKSLSQAVKNEIREQYKGERVSIKKQKQKHIHAAAIKKEFNGTNLKEIIDRYGVSKTTVYRLINK